MPHRATSNVTPSARLRTRSTRAQLPAPALKLAMGWMPMAIPSKMR